MKLLIYISAFSIVGSCATLSNKEKIQNIKDGISIHNPEHIEQYANSITSNELKEHLYKFASAEFQGRKVGSQGQKLASNYIIIIYQREYLLQ
jgi:hypothetical protein